MPAKAFKILVLPGDGIGPEVVAEGVKVLRAIERRFGHRFDLQEDIVGGAAIDALGIPLKPETTGRGEERRRGPVRRRRRPEVGRPEGEVRPEQARPGASEEARAVREPPAGEDVCRR